MSIVELFVGVLGASSYVYAEACLAQDLPSWITVHVRMVEFLGVAPARRQAKGVSPELRCCSRKVDCACGFGTSCLISASACTTVDSLKPGTPRGMIESGFMKTTEGLSLTVRDRSYEDVWAAAMAARPA